MDFFPRPPKLDWTVIYSLLHSTTPQVDYKKPTIIDLPVVFREAFQSGLFYEEFNDIVKNSIYSSKWAKVNFKLTDGGIQIKAYKLMQEKDLHEFGMEMAKIFMSHPAKFEHRFEYTGEIAQIIESNRLPISKYLNALDGWRVVRMDYYEDDYRGNPYRFIVIIQATT